MAYSVRLASSRAPLQIGDAPHTGIMGSGNNNVFVNNTLRDLAYETSDTGAWYSGRCVRGGGHRLQGLVLYSCMWLVLQYTPADLGWPAVTLSSETPSCAFATLSASTSGGPRSTPSTSMTSSASSTSSETNSSTQTQGSL